MPQKPQIAQNLRQFGWSEKEVLVYASLLEQGEATPNQIANRTGLNRTTTYVILKQFEAKGIAARFLKQRKTAFRIEHPSKLKELLDSEKQNVSQKEKALSAVLSVLVSQYNLVRGKPAVRFFEGKDGLAQIYDDILKTGKPLHLIRSPVDIHFFQEEVERFINQRVKKQIPVVALTPDTPQANRDPKKDEAWLLKRRWVPFKFYNAPVEVDIYGDKVALLSFEKEAIGVIIESPQIAMMFRQIFDLAALGAEAAMKLEK